MDENAIICEHYGYFHETETKRIESMLESKSNDNGFVGNRRKKIIAFLMVYTHLQVNSRHP